MPSGTTALKPQHALAQGTGAGTRSPRGRRGGRGRRACDRAGPCRALGRSSPLQPGRSSSLQRGAVRSATGGGRRPGTLKLKLLRVAQCPGTAELGVDAAPGPARALPRPQRTTPSRGVPRHCLSGIPCGPALAEHSAAPVGPDPRHGEPSESAPSPHSRAVPRERLGPHSRAAVDAQAGPRHGRPSAPSPPSLVRVRAPGSTRGVPGGGRPAAPAQCPLMRSRSSLARVTESASSLARVAAGESDGAACPGQAGTTVERGGDQRSERDERGRGMSASHTRVGGSGSMPGER